MQEEASMVHGGPMSKRYCWSMVHGPMAHGGPWWPLPWEKYCWFLTWLRRRRQSGRPRCSCSLLPELNRLRCFWFVESESDFVHLCSCDDDLLLQLLDACHVPHVVKILQTGLDIIQCSPTIMVSIGLPSIFPPAIFPPSGNMT